LAKMFILGILLMVFGFIGMMILLVVAYMSFTSLGILSGNPTLLSHINFHGLISYLYFFKIIGGIGFLICIIDAILSIKTKY